MAIKKELNHLPQNGLLPFGVSFQHGQGYILRCSLLGKRNSNSAVMLVISTMQLIPKMADLERFHREDSRGLIY